MTPFDMGFLLGGAVLLLFGLLAWKWDGAVGVATGLVMVLIVIGVKALAILGWQGNWAAIIAGSIFVTLVAAFIVTRS